MTVISLTENNTRCYEVTVQNNVCVRVQKFENISDDENNIISVKPSNIFSGKSEVSDMTMMSGAFDKSIFDANVFLFKIIEENDRHRYAYIGGHMICLLLTNDNIYRYISKMGNVLPQYSMTIGDENIYFLIPHFKFIKREKIIIDELLKSNRNSVHPFDYHVSNCKDGLFKKLRIKIFHSIYDN